MSEQNETPCRNSACPAGALDFVFFEWLDDYESWVISTGDDYSGRVYAAYCPFCGHALMAPNVEAA